MSKQFKLYKIDKNMYADTIQILNKYKHVLINKYIVALEYNDTEISYQDLLDQLSKCSVSQYIFTTSKFYRLLTKFVESNIKIQQIKLNSLSERDNNKIKRYINDINKQEGNNLNDLLDLLKYYNYDAGIDISQMSFVCNSDNNLNKVVFHNNGDMILDSENGMHQVGICLADIL